MQLKKLKRRLQVIGTMLVLSTIGCALWLSGAAKPAIDASHKVLCFQDSMHPWIKSDQPGKCTICAMDLTPIYEGEKGLAADDGVVLLSSNSITVLNVQTEEVKRQPLRLTVRVAGTMDADETRKAIFSAPAAGRIHEMVAGAVGDEVEVAKPLLTFSSPELATWRRAYVVRGRTSTSATPLFAGRTHADAGSNVRFKAGANPMADTHGAPAVSSTEPDPYFSDLLSPLSGTIVERKVFNGVISVIEPMLDEATRTVKVRANITNPVVGDAAQKQRLLRLGMYAEGSVLAELPGVLTVPRTAVLFPGGRAYAYVEESAGAYVMRSVKLGRQGDGLCEVLEGLDEGDRVVTTGNVLIDAQAQFTQPPKHEPAEGEGKTRLASSRMQNHASEDVAEMENALEVAQPVRIAGSATALTEAQEKALGGFLSVASEISAALASDSLSELQRAVPRLKVVTAVVPSERAATQPLLRHEDADLRRRSSSRCAVSGNCQPS